MLKKWLYISMGAILLGWICLCGATYYMIGQ